MALFPLKLVEKQNCQIGRQIELLLNAKIFQLATCYFWGYFQFQNSLLDVQHLKGLVWR